MLVLQVWPRNLIYFGAVACCELSQVSACSDCNVQRVGFDIAIHTPHQMPEDRVQKGPPDCNPIAFSSSFQRTTSQESTLTKGG